MVINGGRGFQMFSEPFSKSSWGCSNVFFITIHPVTLVSVDDSTLLLYRIFILGRHQEVLDSGTSFKGLSESIKKIDSTYGVQVHAVCDPESLLVVLLKLLFFDISCLYLSCVNVSWLLYTSLWMSYCFWTPKDYCGIWAVGVFIFDISVCWVFCKAIQTFVQGVACTSMVGSHSVHFICGIVSLISVSNLP